MRVRSAKSSSVKPELPERVVDPRVKPSRDQKEFRAEVFQGREEPVTKGTQNLLAPRSGGEGTIDGQSGTFAHTCLGSVPGARIPRPLVRGEIKN